MGFFLVVSHSYCPTSLHVAVYHESASVLAVLVEVVLYFGGSDGITAHPWTNPWGQRIIIGLGQVMSFISELGIEPLPNHIW